MAQSRVAGHAQQVELADDIAEDDCAIAGHSDTDYSLSFGPPMRSARLPGHSMVNFMVME